MLKSFEVKDYALIEHALVEFESGLNIITGETGAGKSLLVDAMGLLLGERASTEVVRKGAAKAVVEGIFNIEKSSKAKQLLDENEIDILPELIIRREISVKGSNRCFINDTPVQLSIVRDIGNLLVDLHGQHEHQSLLRTETHIHYLDEFGYYQKQLINYQNIYNNYIEKEKELEELKKKEKFLKEKKDMLAFQLKEIDAVAPEKGEDDKLQGELNILENSEKLIELSNKIYNLLYESENSVYDTIVQVKNDIEFLAGIDENFAQSANEAETILALINDVSSFVRSYKEKIELEPEQVEEIRERLGNITLLKKKYGGTLSAVIKKQEEIREEYELAENYSSKIKELSREVIKLKQRALAEAKKISTERKKIAIKVKTGIESSLKELGITNPDFKTEIGSEKNNLTSLGIDRVEFFISTNAGEDPKPLVKVASGGEVSRIMLSLKSTLAKSDKLPLLIFDEIDVGISGRIAQKVGKALKELAAFHQIIAITHLPQIAGLADHHYSIEKASKGERTVSSIKKLSDDERIEEVAKLISGESVTDASIKSARQLMGV